MSKTGIVLSGGGARGAYQAGVLKALGEILKGESRFPFDIVVGVSAGSINATGLACFADNFQDATSRLEHIWGHLTSDQVIKTDIKSLSKIGATWIKDLSLGGALGGGHARGLLDTSPLRELLLKNYLPERTKKNLAEKRLEALAISATNVYTNNSVTFVQGHESVQMWSRHKRIAEKTNIRVDHIMASSAIPIFFPTIEVDGRHFTDGCIGNVAPLSPAVHLGADRIIAVGVRSYGMESETNLGPRGQPTMAHMSGLLLNAVFMDAIEMDIQRMLRINEVLEVVGKHEQWQPIEILQISPSESIGAVAEQYYKNIPRVVRYLMKGLGDQGSIEEIASYLLFDTSFCSRLIEMGYNDAFRVRGKIETLMKRP